MANHARQAQEGNARRGGHRRITQALTGFEGEPTSTACWTGGQCSVKPAVMSTLEQPDSARVDPHAADRALRPEEQDTGHWKADGWAARIVKNEEDDGWAVEMTRDGELEPALVGPWTMGRDKRSPKPLDVGGFKALVKAATDVRTRHMQQLRAQLHRNVTVENQSGQSVRFDLDIVPDEDDPHAILTVHSEGGPYKSRVETNFRLSIDSARKYLADRAF